LNDFKDIQMAGSTTSTFAALLKEVYSDEKLVDIVNKESPLFALLKKRADMRGKEWNQPVLYSTNQGIGSTVAYAQSALGSAAAKNFVVPRATKLGVVRIDNELIEAANGSANDRFAFVNALDFEAELIEKGLVGAMCTELYRAGGGAIGKLDGSCNVATASIKLSDVNDVVNFSEGMLITSAATNGTSSTVRAGYSTISAINRNTGVITLSAHMDDGVTSPANTDYLFRYGDFGAVAYGLEAWIPSSDPASTSFCGVDRTTDITRLSGIRHTATGGTVEDCLIDAAILGSRHNAKFDLIVLHPKQAGTLIREIGSKSQYIRTDKSSTALGGSDLTLTVPTQTGTIKIISDSFCQVDVAWFLNISTWTIMSAGQAPHVQTDKSSGLVAFPCATTDQQEMRLCAYWNLSCSLPGSNLRLAF
jgi:hypothetical protein